MVGRVAGTIAGWGREGGYFASPADADAFEAELTSILVNQKAAFNSPVWFNVGFEEQPAVLGLLHPLRRGHDGVDPRLEHQGGHDLPRRLRLGDQPLQHPRLEGAALARAASPPARSASCAAPTPGPARSSRAARRGARRRWSCSTSTTPTSSDFIWCKAREEEKAAALRDAGFDMSIDGEGFHSIQYQNANNSVRVTDEFMDAVERGERVADDRARRAASRSTTLRRARADGPDRRGRLALRRPGRPVRHDDQRLAHLPEHRAGSTRPTRAPSTCTSTTRPATSPRST